VVPVLLRRPRRDARKGGLGRGPLVRQILQNLRTGETELADVPSPLARRGHVLVRTSTTLISTGTERTLVEFGQASLLGKAQAQPDRVRQVIDKVRTDGLVPTLEAVAGKLSKPLPLGYCNVGTVLDTGEDVTSIRAGDRVVSNGPHADVVCVPLNLCARIPPGVPDEHAVFAVPGAIGLQGLRLAQPTLGEAIVVSGLGLIGLLTVQLARAHGCRVLGLDFDAGRLALARQFGAETVDLSTVNDAIRAGQTFSRGRGVDAVIITAATDSSEPVHQAALMCRQRGRIVLVGVTGLTLSRDDFYKKELSFQVSASYGPGRYDPNYEEKGQDYPVGFVRWTENRNFEAVLDMLAERRLDVESLISHRFPAEQATSAYGVMTGVAPSLGILLSFTSTPDARATNVPMPGVLTPRSSGAEVVSVSFIGAGNFGAGVLIPAFKRAGAHLRAVVSSRGVSSLHAARTFGFAQAATDLSTIFDDPEAAAVVIASRHESHAEFVTRGLLASKSVFVEKPLCLSLPELDRIEALYTRLAREGKTPRLMIGFNRRFAPHVTKIRELLSVAPGPKSFVMTVNAGAVPQDHWVQDAAIGGGRIIGEACHFVDLLRFLAGSPVQAHHSTRMEALSGDTVTLQLAFSDGSIGTIHYFANGSRRFPKERLEVFADGGILQLDNFRRLRGFGWPGFGSMNLWRQDKGQRACAQAFVNAVRDDGPSPIPFEEVVEVTRTTILLAGS